MKIPRCIVKGCSKQGDTKRGRMCYQHYMESYYGHQLELGRICEVEGCDRAVHAKGYCHAHYNQLKTKGEVTKFSRERMSPKKTIDLCSFDGCSRPHYAKNYCQLHYRQAKLGISLAPIKKRGSNQYKDKI